MTTVWTPIPKASGQNWTQIPTAQFASVSTANIGEPIGLLLALTHGTSQAVVIDPWTSITGASNTIWTEIPKAT